MELSYEYIRGLIDGEGCFTFCSAPNLRSGKVMIPAFVLRMSVRDKGLIEAVRDTLRLRNKVHTYSYLRDKTGPIKRQPQSVLIVRDFGSLRDKIIPLFYKKLHGYKAKQFSLWIEKMGIDPLVPRDYQLLNKLYNKGYFELRALKFP